MSATMNNPSPELLSPAGNLRALQLAFAYGADAVFAGLPRLSLRVRNNDFDLSNLARGIDLARAANKQFYVVANVIPGNAKINSLMRDLEPVIALEPDALIVSDPGIIHLLQQTHPQLPLHLSVQANSINWASVAFWRDQGLARVILARELALEEIAEIRERVPEMELEVFVHGALCMAYSGRCLLSAYSHRRDANQGACNNACRWAYTPTEPIALTPAEGGEPLVLEEDEHGSYVFNARDLRAIEYVGALADIGVASLKIEGRTKSPCYVARTAQAYRRALDDWSAGRSFDPSLVQQLDGLANRGYTPGFLRRHIPMAELQNYERGASVGEQQWVGEFSPQKPQNGSWLVDVKNHFELGDQLTLLTPEGNQTFVLDDIRDNEGQPLTVAPGSGHSVRIKLPHSIDPTTALLVKNVEAKGAAVNGVAVKNVEVKNLAIKALS